MRWTVAKEDRFEAQVIGSDGSEDATRVDFLFYESLSVVYFDEEVDCSAQVLGIEL